MPSYKVEVLPLGRTLIGEGPHWDAKTQELLYVDIYGKSVHRYNPVTGQERRVVIDEVGERAAVSFVIPVQSQPDTYLIAYNGDIRVLRWPAGNEPVQNVSPTELKTLHSVPVNDPPTTVNDAKCDSKGRLWTGTLCVRFKGSLQNWELVKGVSHLFCLDPEDGRLSTHLEGVDLSNGLAWSPDGTQFYYNDSGLARVDAFDYDMKTGTISNRRAAFDFKTNGLEGFPDGMCIDSNGNLWIAAYSTGKMLNVNPHTGQLLGAVEFPGNKKITSCAFGGRNLDELYVTSAHFELSDEEKAATPQGPGSIYKVTGLGVKGASAGVPYAGKV